MSTVLCLKYLQLLDKLQTSYNKLTLVFTALFAMRKFTSTLISIIRNFGCLKNFAETSQKILFLLCCTFTFIWSNWEIWFQNFWQVVMQEDFTTQALLLLQMLFSNQMQEKLNSFKSVKVSETKKIGLFIASLLVKIFL